MNTPSFENKAWAEASRAPQLSLVMLFGDLGRWQLFAKQRFQEMTASGIFSEVVFVLNTDDPEVKTKVKEDADRNFSDFPILIMFRKENNIPASRNAGVQMARGNSILIWDDDDSCEPKALNKAFTEVFVSGNFPLLELPLAHGDDSAFHPQAPELMPQIEFPGRRDLVIVGMPHTPFFATKELLTQVPIPEHVALRGDWLHWGVDLWRAGIPIVCLKGRVAKELDRSRDIGATASSAVSDLSRFHSLVSLLLLFCNYRIPKDSSQAEVVRRRYFEKYCPECQDDTWRLLMEMGNSLSLNKSIETVKGCNGCQTHQTLRKAFEHVKNLRDRGLVSPNRKATIDVGPFEIFNPDRRSELISVLKNFGVNLS